MTFADTYREERLINRRSRARKARIAGRIIGFALTACFVVALRTDPQLRGMVEDLAMAAIGVTQPETSNVTSAQANAIGALGYTEGSAETQALDTLGITNESEPTAPASSHMPQSRVKINRPNSG